MKKEILYGVVCLDWWLSVENHKRSDLRWGDSTTKTSLQEALEVAREALRNHNALEEYIVSGNNVRIIKVCPRSSMEEHLASNQKAESSNLSEGSK